MKKQTDYEITLSGGIYKAIEHNPDGSITIKLKTLGEPQPPKVDITAGLTFTCIPVSIIKKTDDFMYYVPRTENEMEFKQKVENMLSTAEMEDFFIPVNFFEMKFRGEPINFLGCDSASCNAWISNAEYYDCEILKFSQYIGLLSWMLKTLIEKEKWEHKKAWYSICEDSELLHKLDWENIFGFKNFLGTTKRFLLPDDPSQDTGCFIASGGLNGRDWKHPLAQIIRDPRRDCNLKEASYGCYGFMTKQQ